MEHELHDSKGSTRELYASTHLKKSTYFSDFNEKTQNLRLKKKKKKKKKMKKNIQTRSINHYSRSIISHYFNSSLSAINAFFHIRYNVNCSPTLTRPKNIYQHFFFGRNKHSKQHLLQLANM